MDLSIYQKMADHQSSHWWFCARREILDDQIRSLLLPPDSGILEIGCGTGGNLAMLKQHGNVHAMEMNDFAISQAMKVSDTTIRKGSLPDCVPWDKGSFDLICLFDVMEHIQDDRAAMESVIDLLKTRGKILLTVPAYAWLYGAHDQSHHHFRRYTKRSLRVLLSLPKIRLLRATYFNTLLFPIAAATRIAENILVTDNPIGQEKPAQLVNEALYRIFRLEKNILRTIDMPFGVSLMAVAEKY